MISRAWRWLTDPVCSSDGLPSFPKLMAVAVFWAFTVGRPIPVAVCAMLLASSYGLKTFQMFLARSSFTVQESGTVKIAVEKKIIETVTARRDPAEGIEETP